MSKYPDINVEERIDLGVKFFMQGHNCSQSVVCAFADVYSLDMDVAMRVAASFGGGIGRLRLTCGAVSGMCILAGLECGTAETDPKIRETNYSVVRELVERFNAENGSITCSELLGMKKGVKESARPGDRNAEYYASRPCAGMVASACKIYAEYLVSL